MTDGDVARKWWREITDPKSGNRAALAQLRRCHTPYDAIVLLPALDLARRLGRTGENSRVDDALGLAVVLAHVKKEPANEPGTNHPKRLMRAAGWPTFPGGRGESEAAERPILSERRFRRLLQTMPEEKIDAFRRLVRSLGSEANVRDLAESFLWWGDNVKRKWSFEYFAAGQSVPPKPTFEQGAE